MHTPNTLIVNRRTKQALLLDRSIRSKRRNTKHTEVFVFLLRTSVNRTTLFTGEQLYLLRNNFIHLLQMVCKQNKVIPKQSIFHAQIHELQLNLSCSLTLLWASLSGITGKIKLFPHVAMHVHVW
jgi:hypothetical protein